ncbi:MAG: response regulator transcription factor [Propionibacteriaceae bacterium]|nr:response regulator transcription factor [Propionibacteriaceae bacterium]
MSTILIVDDEPQIAAFVAKGLKSAGFSSTQAASGSDAVTLATHGDFDLILLDVGLPDIDGFKVLHRIRERGIDTPIIMLTARKTVPDRIAGLEGGADDYVGKPFSFEELLLRIRLRLRRESTLETTGSELVHEDIRLDLRARRLLVGDRTMDLSAREFSLAETFLRNPGRVLSRQQLLSHAWGYDADPESNVVDVYVRHLRAKLGKDRIETVRGLGYRLISHPSSSSLSSSSS